MKPQSLVVVGFAAFSNGIAHSLDAAVDAPRLVQRGAPAAPSGYTPVPTQCPGSRPSIRAANSLSPQESDWLKSRISNIAQPLQDLVVRLNISGFDAASWFKDHASDNSTLPKIGIGASGGGYRALMNGAGALAAFDDRTPNATAAGQLGGLLQSAVYLAGLSGGNWLVGSIYQNNFTSVQSIIDGDVGSVWDFSNSILEGPNHGLQILTTADYYATLHDQVSGKGDAGFNTTFTDIWGRSLAFQLINADDGGPAYTWSSLASGSYITNGSAPLPISIADQREPGDKIIPDNTTIVEFNPWEIGSWDPTIYGFAPTMYIGSNFTNGTLSSDQDCVLGYDSASFVMGTSSSLFNQFVLSFNGSDLPSAVTDFISGLLRDFDESEEDIASWVNPFYGWNPSNNPSAAERQLTLVDGGENNENIPLHPLIQPVRGVDVIFAIDSSADTSFNWPNGSSLVSTYERSLNNTLQNGTAFPFVPDTNTFINLGLNQRPTFFGCDSDNVTDSGAGNTIPVIVYLPNAPYSTFSNVSTFNLSYATTTRNDIIQNGYNVATRGNSSLASDWPACVACAIMRRSLERTSTAIPETCTTCFQNYCWDGTLNATEPASYEPSFLLGADQNSSGGNDNDNHGNDAPAMSTSLVGVIAAVVGAALLIM